MHAFPEGATQKDTIVASVARAIDAGLFLDDDHATNGSLIKCVVDDGDVRTFERETGIPGSLALLADMSVGFRTDDLPAARRFAGIWIATPVPGADLTRVPNAMILWVIDRAEQIWRSAFHDDPSEVLRTIRELHARQSSGQDPDRTEWSKARGDALARTDAETDDRRSLINRMAETLAWPPLTSRTILSEGVRILADMAGAVTAANAPMTQEERAGIHRTMEALFAETEAERDADPEGYFFPDIFHARMPEIAERFTADLNAQNAAVADTVVAAGDKALELMGAAPRA